MSAAWNHSLYKNCQPHVLGATTSIKDDGWSFHLHRWGALKRLSFMNMLAVPQGKPRWHMEASAEAILWIPSLHRRRQMGRTRSTEPTCVLPLPYLERSTLPRALTSPHRASLVVRLYLPHLHFSFPQSSGGMMQLSAYNLPNGSQGTAVWGHNNTTSSPCEAGSRQLPYTTLRCYPRASQRLSWYSFLFAVMAKVPFFIWAMKRGYAFRDAHKGRINLSFKNNSSRTVSIVKQEKNLV